MKIKISQISQSHLEGNVLTKGIRAKVEEVYDNIDKKGERYGKYLLVEGKSRIYALAFEEAYQKAKHILKTGIVTQFPPNTFSCKLRNKKFKSNSKCKYELHFRPLSKFFKSTREGSSTTVSSSGCNDVCSIRDVTKLLTTAHPFKRKLLSIKFNGGEVHRYLGCKTCTFSIPRKHTDNKYYCKGMCNVMQTRKSKIGVLTERKICCVIQNVELTDEQNNKIDSVLIFDGVCESLLKKRGTDFISDNDALEAWSQIIKNNNRYNISIKRNKKKPASSYPPALFVERIDKEQQTAISTPVVESDVQYSIDDNDAHLNFGKKKKQPKAYFPKFEMKLESTLGEVKKLNFKYEIKSKPTGLVLLINIHKFPHMDETEREGSFIDMDFLIRGFIVMGLEIYKNKCHMDVNFKEFYKLLDDFKEELVNKKVDSSFIVISSHGKNFQVDLSGLDNICVIEDMLTRFSDENFPAFQGKPKIFMPLTCQNFGSTRSGKKPSLDYQGNHLFDMMVCFPCLPGYSAWRLPDEGTLYVRILMYNLMKYATSWHFRDILEQTQKDIAEQIIKKKLKTTPPCWISSTFRQLYLVPQAAAVGNDDNCNGIEDMDVDE